MADAVAAGDGADLADELGDLLFQSVFLAQLLEEDGRRRPGERRPRPGRQAHLAPPPRLRRRGRRVGRRRASTCGSGASARSAPTRASSTTCRPGCRRSPTPPRRRSGPRPPGSTSPTSAPPWPSSTRRRPSCATTRARASSATCSSRRSAPRGRSGADPELALRASAQRFRGRVERAVALAAAAGEDFERLAPERADALVRGGRADDRADRRSGRPCGRTRSRWARGHLRDLFADDPARGDELIVEAGDLRLDYSKNRVTRETLDLLVALAERGRRGPARRGDVPRRAHQRHRGPRGAPHRPARAARRGDRGGRPRRGARTSTRCSTGWARSPRRVRSGRVDRRDRRAHPHRRQHRHRRLRPRARRWPCAPSPTTPRRRSRSTSSRTSTATTSATRSPARDPASTLVIVVSKTFTTLETLANARDARALDRRRARRGRGAEALRRRLDQRRGGRGVRHRHRQHGRVLGLGRRALLGRLGRGPVAGDRDRRRRVPRVPRRLPGDRRALPQRAARPRTCRC